MDRDTLSFLAHAEHSVACPFDDHTVAELLGRIEVPAGGAVIDIGCGRAEWLLRLLAQRPEVHGVGVDRSEPAIAAARAHAQALGMAGRVELVCADAGAHVQGVGCFDAALCMGSTQALGSLGPALARLRELLRPGGAALVGEPFWQRAPTDAARAVLGLADGGPDPYTDLAGLVDAASAAGFVPLHLVCSSEREWDRYEWSWCGALEKHALTHPDAPDIEQVVAAARGHRDAYLRGYRDILGFAAMVLRLPAPPEPG